MKKNIFQWCLIAMVGCMPAFNAVAQFDPMFTQYMFNELFINPAYAGSRECMSVTGLVREQWVGIEGAPSTQTLSLHAPVFHQKMGIGLSMINEGIGVSKRTGVNLNAAYRIKMEKGWLSFGLNGGVVSLNEDLMKLNLTTDNMFMVNAKRLAAPNVGFGVYYNAPKWYVGLSIPRMIRNHISTKSGSAEVENTFSPEEFHYYLTGGSVHKLNHSITLRPNVMVKAVSGAPVEVDISANLLFNDFIWAGLAYRTNDAASVFIGAYLTQQLRFGYAYDYTLSGLQDFNSGSHELMLGYDFNYDKSKVSTPRHF
ncbi:MAG TPA: type IX secretion system membrane protein PorP/SprF [Flavobacteriales bacterium]